MKKLLLTFFENEKYPGWKNIAEKLIETGKCIVAGDECIWKGAIGHFIHTTKAEGAIGCSLYTFDLEYFKTSEWYKVAKVNYLKDLYLVENTLKRDLLKIQTEIKETK